jgi:glycine cleavage system T protein (aminomethyltransferase)
MISSSGRVTASSIVANVEAGTLKRTPLYDAHVVAGAKLVDFAGWEMPVEYDGIRAEHLRVRGSGGIFDVSHMGEIETEGPQAAELLQRLLTNDVSKIQVAGAQYSCLCREDGGVLDDLFTYRLADDRYLTVTNAANHERDLEWFEAHAVEFEAEVRDRIDDYAMLAVQGPQAREIVARLADGELPARFRSAELAIAGAPALVCGTGYTGEEGVELLIASDGARTVWDAVIGAGASPAGLGARDTLRLEVNYCLYGNDLTEERTPIEAALGWCVKEDTGFVGSEACRQVREEGPAEILKPFVLTGSGIPRQGNPIIAGDEPVGEVTSGTMSPCLEVGIGMGYVRSDLAEPETEVEIDVRGRRRTAEIRKAPLYSKD